MIPGYARASRATDTRASVREAEDPAGPSTGTEAMLQPGGSCRGVVPGCIGCEASRKLCSGRRSRAVKKRRRPTHAVDGRRGSPAVCPAETRDGLTAWVDHAGDFVSVTRTTEELSIVCAIDVVPTGVQMEGPWRAFKVQGPLVMTLIGVVAALANPPAHACISIFAISTYDTDYILVTSRTSTPRSTRWWRRATPFDRCRRAERGGRYWVRTSDFLGVSEAL